MKSVKKGKLNKKKYIFFFMIFVVCVIYTVLISKRIYAIANTESEVNVRLHGIKGDGVSDDTENIIKVLKENVGKDIYFPTGIYVISDRINIYSNTTIRGDGMGTIFLAEDGKPAGTDMFQIDNAKNINIEDICISGNKIVNNGNQYSDVDGIHLLDMWNVEDIEIKNCYFIDNVYCAVRIFSGTDIVVTNSLFLNVDCGIVTLGKYDVNNLKVDSCYFKGHNRSEAISLYGTGTYSQIELCNNVIEDKTDGHGIMFNEQSVNKDIFIKNNIVNNCAVAISVFQVQNGEIIDNIVNGTTSGRGIEIYNCKDILVKNNIITNTYYDSIAIRNCFRSTFENNDITITANAQNSNMAGIKIVDECQKLYILKNSIKRVGKSLNKYSIFVKGNGDISIKENELHNLPIYTSEDSKGINYIDNK